MSDNVLGIIMIIIGVVSYFFLKSQGIFFDFKFKGRRMKVTKYETKTVPNPRHRVVKAKSLQHYLSFIPKDKWLGIFPPENRNIVSVLLSRKTIYIKQFLSQDLPIYETVSLETADQLLNHLSISGEEMIIQHGEKWGDIIM